ncbi:MAG: hypothetical protein WC829_01075 [Hyphomicrobium sp.]|jgi:hypothetical protein
MGPIVQQDQIKGMLDRAIAVMATMFLSWMVKKGWLGESDAATLLPALVLLPALAWGWWNNRDKALIQSAANVVDLKTGQKTVIVTSPEMAKDTPDQNNIVSSTDVKVIQK